MNRNYTVWWFKNWRRFDKEYRRELCRQKFWGFMMIHFEKLYEWCDQCLKCDTLPFQVALDK